MKTNQLKGKNKNIFLAVVITQINNFNLIKLSQETWKVDPRDTIFKN